MKPPAIFVRLAQTLPGAQPSGGSPPGRTHSGGAANVRSTPDVAFDGLKSRRKGPRASAPSVNESALTKQQAQLQMLAQGGRRLHPQAIAKADAQALEAGLRASLQPPPVPQRGEGNLSSRQARVLGALQAGIKVKPEAIEAADAAALAAAIEMSKVESLVAPDMPKDAGAGHRPLPTPPGGQAHAPEPQPTDHLAQAMAMQKMQAQQNQIEMAQHKAKLRSAASEAMKDLTRG
ncbi:hypothetical protein [Paraburkholderia bannensis]|uniref:hypothetical protein n=2 Tax=Paraburkholderia bannensis TaxID=765414 RepID=UPI002AB68DE3|nr:hypothetical protein [Paraburkholderia bannensis]